MNCMEVTNVIKTDWSEYDQSVAKCHLYNYGQIYLDVYGCPVDNFDWLEMVIQNGKTDEEYR